MDIRPKYGIEPNIKKEYDLDNIFTFHKATKEQNEKYCQLREESKKFAALILNICPVSRERSLALTKLEESCMWANAGIARNE